MNEVTVNVILVDLKKEQIWVSQRTIDNALLANRVYHKLKLEHDNIVTLLKLYKKRKLIKSIWIPKTKDWNFKKRLINIVRIKKRVTTDMELIKRIFFN